MATSKNDGEQGVVGRLAGRGEETVSRLVDELGKNRRITEALQRVVAAKGKVDSASRGALGQLGLASADEVKKLRKDVDRLEKRLAKLEGKPARKQATSRATASKDPGKPTRTRGKKDEEPTVSPAPGRSIGGGTARGSG